MNSIAVDDGLRARLRQRRDDAANVELTGLIGFQNLSSKFNAALDFAADSPPQARESKMVGPKRASNAWRSAASTSAMEPTRPRSARLVTP